ncbi:MAG: type II secretion system F family protein, partial [Gemmatimonadota bacterium]
LVLNVGEATAKEAAGGGSFFKTGVRREVLEVTRALAALLPVGMPLARALDAASGVTAGEVKAAMVDVRERVERGDTMSTALANHPSLFSPMYVGLVRAGERSGDLDAAFARLASQLERDELLRGRITSAAIYPLILATAGTSAVLVLVLFVLPKFVTLLQGSGTKLPASTAAMLAVSTLLRRFWPVLLAIPALGSVLAAWIRTTEEGKRFWSSALLTIPAVKTMRQYALSARFARLVGVLLGGGAPLLMALDDTVESITDPIARDDAVRIRTRVREGSSLREAVSESAIFPPLLSQLIGVGEDAGEVRIFLLKAAEIFEERTER